MIRVTIAMQEPLRRVGARATLEAAPDIQVCGSTSAAGQVRTLVESETPDVLLLESDFQHADRDLMKDLLAINPSLAILVCVEHSDEECALRHLAGGSEIRLTEGALERLNDCCLVGLRAHARGCIPRSAEPEQILEAVRHAHLGEVVAAPWLQAFLPANLDRANGIGLGPQRITAREVEVIELVGEGLSNREISDRLGIREQTVKNHTGRVLRKLRLRNRMELAVFAVRYRLAGTAPDI